MDQKAPECTKCKSNSAVIPIIIGRPGKELIEKAERGEVKLGGCCMGEDMKHWYCKTCSTEF